MNSRPPSDPVAATLRYYDDHAEEFIARTREIDLGPLYDEFLRHIPAGGTILDAGCGSGRDTHAFSARGYTVMAFDGSEALVQRASAFTGKPVLHMTFDEVRFTSEFDGVWASASLLHLPANQIDLALNRLVAALKPGGVLYMSLKKGVAEEWRDGRFFADYDEEKAETLLRHHGQLEPVRVWTLHDVSRDTLWLNVIARRVS